MINNKETHVVHLIASSALYGAEKWILALMRAMDNSKVRSTLVNLSDFQNKPSAVVAAAKKYGLYALDFYTGGTFNPLSIMRFSRWLKTNQIDIVHGHGYKSDLIGLFAAKLSGCKMISTPHGWSRGEDKKLQFYESLDRFLFRFMDYVCPLSEDLLESIRHCTHIGKVKLILNGVDLDEIKDQNPSELECNTAFRIGYIGQLIERKNLQTLIKSLEILFKNGIQSTITIVGDGPEREKLEKLTGELGIQNSVNFLGYRTDAISILKTFDVFVLPSLLEGIPRCVMEAMAAEVSVIASDIPGNRDIVKEKETGLLFCPTDERLLSDALLFLINNREVKTMMARNAHVLINTEFSNHRMASEYALVYSSVKN